MSNDGNEMKMFQEFIHAMETVKQVSGAQVQYEKRLSTLEDEIKKMKIEHGSIKKDVFAEFDKKINSLKVSTNISDSPISEDISNIPPILDAENQQSEPVEMVKEDDEDVQQLKEQIKRQIQRCEDIRKNAERLKDENRALRNENAALKEENAELFKLAYTDVKTGTKNTNAFNRDFRVLQKDGISLIMVGICGMKEINNNFGRGTGDKIISQVAQSLMSAFSSESVYRIIGDQFAILHDSMNSEELVLSVKKSLNEESVHIVYGIANGSECANSMEMLSVAESDMKNAKNADYSKMVKPENADTFFDKKDESPVNDEPTELSADDILAGMLDV